MVGECLLRRCCGDSARSGWSRPAWDHESTTSLRGAESGVKNVVKKHKALRTTPQKAAAAAAGIDRCCDEQ